MTKTIRFDMGQTYQVLQAVVDAPTETDRKRFTRMAALALAKEMLACGCVFVDQQYDIERQAFRLSAIVRTGRKERKLPD